jgi:hypothetical protein
MSAADWCLHTRKMKDIIKFNFPISTTFSKVNWLWIRTHQHQSCATSKNYEFPIMNADNVDEMRHNKTARESKVIKLLLGDLILVVNQYEKNIIYTNKHHG